MPGHFSAFLYHDPYQAAPPRPPPTFSKVIVKQFVTANTPRPVRPTLPPTNYETDAPPRQPEDVPSNGPQPFYRRRRRRVHRHFHRRLISWSDMLDRIKMKKPKKWWQWYKKPVFPTRACDPGEIFSLRQQLRALQASFPTDRCSARFRAVDQFLQSTLIGLAPINRKRYAPKCSNGYWIAEELKALALLGVCMKKSIDKSMFIRPEDLNAVNHELRWLRYQAEMILKYPSKKKYLPPPGVRIRRPDRDKLLSYISPKLLSIGGAASLAQIFVGEPMRKLRRARRSRSSWDIDSFL